MTTAAHVLLPRETVEKLRRLAQEELGEALSERERERWFPIVTALDAALSADEPWERLEDGHYRMTGGVALYELEDR